MHLAFSERQPRKHARPPENVLAESKEGPGLIREHGYPCRSRHVRELRGPDLALERDHEGRPDERGHTCPAPTCLRCPRVWKIQLPMKLPLRPKMTSQSSPYPPPFMAIPASQPLISPTRTDAPNISKCMTRPP